MVYDIEKGRMSPLGGFNWWGQPAEGYYCLTKRPDILRKHAIQLRDAGIDYIVVDMSNWDRSTDPTTQEMVMQPFEQLLKVWSQIPGAPRVVPAVPTNKVSRPLVTWTLDLLNKYKKMTLFKDGKPFFLVASNPMFTEYKWHDPDLLKSFAKSWSYRSVWVEQQHLGNWSFMSWCRGAAGNILTTAQIKAGAKCNQIMTKSGSAVEHLAITPAYNYYIFSDPTQAVPKLGGTTFLRQFETLFNNPNTKHVMFSNWNSWITIRFCKRPNGTLSTTASECPNPNKAEFVDDYLEETSRDFEPSLSQGDKYYRLLKGCIARFRMGQSCDASVLNEVPSVPYGATLKDAVARSCSFPQVNPTHKVAAGEVLGHIDGSIISGNRVYLKGWVCAVGHNFPIRAQLWLKGPKGSPQGYKALEGLANATTEAAVNQACGTKIGTNHRFNIDITSLMEGPDSGARMFVHGSSHLAGKLEHLIHRSGRCAVPWLEKIVSRVDYSKPPTPAPTPTPAPPRPTPAPGFAKMNRAESNDVLWSANGAIDQGGGVYSSKQFRSSVNDRGTFLAAWAPKMTAKSVRLKARMYKGKALGFPKRYNIFVTSADNSRWILSGSFSTQPDANGFVTIPLHPQQTYGVLITPTELGRDDNNAFFLQMDEISLGY